MSAARDEPTNFGGFIMNNNGGGLANLNAMNGPSRTTATASSNGTLPLANAQVMAQQLKYLQGVHSASADSSKAPPAQCRKFVVDLSDRNVFKARDFHLQNI